MQGESSSWMGVQAKHQFQAFSSDKVIYWTDR